MYDIGLLGASDPEIVAVGVCGDGVVSSVERCDTAIAAGSAGACPRSCSSDDPCSPAVLTGSECLAQCLIVRVSHAQNGDHCCPEGVSAAEDSDCGSCGDEIIGPQETCDPPQMCATAETCARCAACVVTELSGDAAQCTSSCHATIITTCQNDDGCCPTGCDSGSDNDCSGTCGNGILDMSAGETCEPGSATAPCATSCDDGLACTQDLLTGSPGNCNVQCSHIPIEYTKGGDGCCPPGASANADSDCMPQCGNAVIEVGEECDGGAQCNASCQRTLHSALRHRYSFDGASDSSAVTDSVGALSGTAKNVTLAGDGSILLAGGTSNQYVDLPCSVIRGLSDVTLEAWITWAGGNARQRIFDFGGDDGAGSGTSYLLLAAKNGAGYYGAVLNFTPATADTGNDQVVTASSPLSTTGIHQVAVTFAAGTLQLFLDGALIDSRTGISDGLSEIDFSNCWLGRAQFDAAPELGGRLYEARVYAAALTAAEIDVSASMGPDP